MNQSEFLAITSNLPKAREKSRVQCASDFGFVSHLLQNWHEIFKPITKKSARTRKAIATGSWFRQWFENCCAKISRESILFISLKGSLFYYLKCYFL